MKCIENIDQWFRGKTINHVDDRAINCHTFYFTDNTAARIETEYLGQGMYGPVYCEIDPGKPSWEQ